MASVFNVYGIADDAKEWYAQQLGRRGYLR